MGWCDRLDGRKRINITSALLVCAILTVSVLVIGCIYSSAAFCDHTIPSLFDFVAAFITNNTFALSFT